jgi:phosphoribosylglycinamide formyltransferase-1
MKLALIGYDFPHVRTCDFMLYLSRHHGLKCVLAAPWQKLNLPHNINRTRLKREPPLHPKEVAELLNIPYHSLAHNSEECRKLITEYDLDIAIIGGARILSTKTINAFNYGIVNIHPGLLPENRGLNALQWAVYLDLPQAITSHFIDYRIDAGRFINKELVPLFRDDTIFDVAQRLYDRQFPLLKQTLNAITGKTLQDFPPVKTKTKPHGKIPLEIDRQIPSLFEAYLKRWAE